MGLDNGIYWKPRNDKEKNVDFPDYVVFNYDSLENEYEVCYWRKCLGVRGRIFDIIDNATKVEVDGEECGYELIRADLVQIQQMLIDYLRYPDRWDEENNYWCFDDMKQNLMQNIINLGWMIDYMRLENPMAFVYFLDSY